jgi:hypothetical protein
MNHQRNTGPMLTSVCSAVFELATVPALPFDWVNFHKLRADSSASYLKQQLRQPLDSALVGTASLRKTST